MMPWSLRRVSSSDWKRRHSEFASSTSKRLKRTINLLYAVGLFLFKPPDERSEDVG
jgi:hypothetical protein